MAARSPVPCLPHFQKTIFSALENDPLFTRARGRDLSLEKYRELTFLRCKRVLEFNFLRMDDMLRNPLKIMALVNCLGMYDWSLATKIFLHMLVSRQHGRGRWVSASMPTEEPRGCPVPGLAG